MSDINNNAASNAANARMIQGPPAINQQAGFSLLELMATIAVVGALTAIALPNYQAMVKNNCLTTTTNLLIASMQQARSLAITQGSTIQLKGDSANSYTGGWKITLNEDRNGNGILDDGEDYNGDGLLTPSVTVRDERLTSCTDVTIDDFNLLGHVTYNANGYSVNAFGSNSRKQYFICDDRTGEKGRQLDISPLGRPSTKQVTCS